MNPYLKILTHPFLIAALLGLLLALFFPVKQSKYKVDKTEMIVGNKKKVFLRDVNHDGTFERVIIYYSDIMPRIGIATLDGKVFGETSTRGLIKTEDVVAFYDSNHDSVDEVYTMTRRNDSVFLAICNLYLDSNIEVKSKYLFRIGFVNGQLDWTAVSEFFFKDINKDGYSDVVFSYNALYSLQPRRVIAYDSKNDTIMLSPVSGVKNSVFDLADFDGDGYSEIFLATQTSENLSDTIAIPFHDHKPWMMVLDHNLKFVIKPRPFNARPATFSLFTIRNIDTLFMAGYLNSFGPENFLSSLILFDDKFNMIRKQDIPFYPGTYLIGFMQQKNGTELFCLLCSESGIMRLYDHELIIKRIVNIGTDVVPIVENTYVKKININATSFYVFQKHYVDPGLILLNDAFKPVITMEYPESWLNEKYKHYQIIKVCDDKVLFFIQSGSKVFEYIVSFNKHWYFVYLLYATYYVLMLGLVFLLQFLFKLRLEQKRIIENEILGLQLKSTLSQLDPHFTFNTLNMISGLIAANRRDEANNYLIQFSKLMKATVMEGEKVMISLENELSFVKVYLAMQQIRIGKDFNYTVRIPEFNDLSILIPKRTIHTHVENAVKHGLIHKEGCKHLLIDILQTEKELCIEITDNGIGRDKAGKINSNRSTGQGLRLTWQILKLTGDMARKKYTQEIVDLKDNEGKATGTKVIVKLEI